MEEVAILQAESDVQFRMSVASARIQGRLGTVSVGRRR